MFVTRMAEGYSVLLDRFVRLTVKEWKDYVWERSAEVEERET